MANNLKIVEYRFFKEKPKKLSDEADFVSDFVTEAQAKKFWMESEYKVMHMMVDEGGESPWPVPYIKA